MHISNFSRSVANKREHSRSKKALQIKELQGFYRLLVNT